MDNAHSERVGGGSEAQGVTSYPSGQRVLVCGGRHYGSTENNGGQSRSEALEEQESVWSTLDRLQPSLIIHGGAKGADQIAGDWARMNFSPYCVFPANWDRLGRRAGPVRNGWMLEHGQPDLVVAFPGGKGTKGMVKLAQEAGVPVLEVPRG